jgi:diguanylate cyclase (GGDEF)-like protein
VSNALLVNYASSEAGALTRFLSKRRFRCLPTVPSLKDKRLFFYFGKAEKGEERAQANLVLLNLPILGDSEREKVKSASRMRQVHLFLKKIREMNSTACVILTGGAIEVEEVSALLRGGVYDYVRLPLNLKEIESAIKQGLHNQEQAEEIIRSMSLANEHLAQEKDHLQRWNNHLSRIYELNQTLTVSLNIDDLICTFGENLKELVPYDLLSIFLKGGSGNPDRAWVWDFSKRVKESMKMALLKKLQEKTILSGNQFLLSFSGTSEIKTLNQGAEVVIPLSITGKPMGLMRIARNIGKNKNVPFEANHTQILSMVTTPLCLALRNAQMYQRLHDLAATDELTHVLNRRSFQHVLEREFRRSVRLRTSLALLVIDLDSFKAVNDFFGHLTGDVILREIAGLLKQSVREIDILARYGGEEFVVILPEGEKDACLVAERIRSVVEAHSFNKNKSPIRLTVSIGIAAVPSSKAESPEDLFRLADSAVYLAKDRGRNRVEIASSSEEIKEKVL